MTDVKFPDARPNVIHSVDNCMCYLQGDRPIIVQPCREGISWKEWK